ncbi:alpha-L-rhamnosidase N-terminal domain-containing protein [Plantactinospora siamensis]|uniref:Alpha-L-rhamnosidase N-terminal domain-containing protein n=1 Tax=Plantactinospora siamensis TaxID=555372 RepID=A0ABV6P5J7_9ACTN
MTGGVRWVAVEPPVDLAPARWIWIGGQRALPNTVVRCRREVTLDGPVRRAVARLSADSRYRLTVNGERVGWGPAPCDPRVLEVDRIDLTGLLRAGSNTIAAEVVYFGTGEGTYVAGRPGFICRLDLDHADGRTEVIGTDERWQVAVDRTRRPGGRRRSYLRGWQEITDLRAAGSATSTGPAGSGLDWRAAVPLDVPSDRPPIGGPLTDIVGDARPLEPGTLIDRPIPMLDETRLLPVELTDRGSVHWSADPDDWFDFRAPASPDTRSTGPGAAVTGPAGSPSAGRDGSSSAGAVGWPSAGGDGGDSQTGELMLPASAVGRSWYVTYRLDRQRVGWPVVELAGPAGSTVEVVTAEGHDPTATGWLDHGQFSWSRVILGGTPVRYEPFEYECCRWIQLHVRNPDGPVRIGRVAFRRREYPWPVEPVVELADPLVDRVLTANLNTIRNSAQDAVVDGMGRERQQYSGDGSHQLRVSRLLFGATAQSARFIRTYARGLTREGYFLDSWPGHDRLVRLGQRELELTGWGSMVDHSIGFVLDCWQHYWESGDRDTAVAVFAPLRRFVAYLRRWHDTAGLLPVTGLGSPQVWIDHDAFAEQRDKTCAFNLYAVAMLRSGYASLAELAGQPAEAEAARRLADALLELVQASFWQPERQAYVANLPWADGPDGYRLDDRSLATAVRYDLAPGGALDAMTDLLAGPDRSVGLSYPANAVWRFGALVARRRIQPVLDELRDRWAPMASIRHNGTIQEMWSARPDSHHQWSHCAAGPLIALVDGIVGYAIQAAGGRLARIEPQPGDLTRVTATVAAATGPLTVRLRQADGPLRLGLDLPAGLAVTGADRTGVDLAAVPGAPARMVEVDLDPSPPPNVAHRSPVGAAQHRRTAA